MENTKLPETGSAAKTRNSNLELFRIITMLLIVAHHFVVNSGLLSTEAVYSAPLSAKSLFLLILGAWGKTGINCFVLITGYFMCTSHITAKKFVRLVAEWYFYKVTIWLIFTLTGYARFSAQDLLLTLFPLNIVRQNFIACFVLFYLSIPFLNILVKNMTQKQHVRLLLLLAFVYVLLGTAHRVEMNYFTWFMVLYLLASYIRLYPNKAFDSTKLWGWLTLAFTLLSAASVVLMTWLKYARGIGQASPYILVTDSNTFLAVCLGLSAFMFFKNLKVPQNRVINRIAGSIFAVLCIHASSDTMRKWLWGSLLDNVGHYASPIMPLYAVICVLGVFAVCVLIDQVRILCLEKPFFRWWDRHWDGFQTRFTARENSILSKLHVNSENRKEEGQST